jgi:hypothetical protein
MCKGKTLAPLQAVGSTVWLSYLQRNIYRYLFLVSWPKCYNRDHPCSGSMVLVTCPAEPSTPVLQCRLWRGRKCELSSYAAPELTTPNHSYDLQIWSLSFAHGLTRLSELPCMDPSTKPHIQESEALVKCRLKFLFTISLFENTNYDTVSSRLFEQCNLPDQHSSNHCVILFRCWSWSLKEILYFSL